MAEQKTQSGFEMLAEAFQIFGKYSDTEWPTCCEHDIMHVMVDVDLVSDEDKARLEELHFTPDGDVEGFSSYHFGSA